MRRLLLCAVLAGLVILGGSAPPTWGAAAASEPQFARAAPAAPPPDGQAGGQVPHPALAAPPPGRLAPIPASRPAQQAARLEAIVAGLEVPWALAWAPDGRLFFTERPGRVRVVENGQLRPDPVAGLAASRSTSEGGLMGLDLAPDFAQSNALYVYYTYDAADAPRNRVSRLRLAMGGAEEIVVLDDIPGAGVHDGGALRFGPDGKLYIGTGDARQPSAAQDPSSLAGKVLRLNPDGTVPDDNPIPGSPVFSLGHRNVQAFAWHPQTGNLYAAEHGPTGENGWCCHDEVNLIWPGGNYGWPLVTGAAGDPRFLDPVVESGEGRWPPGGIAFPTAGPWAGDLLLGSLAGGQLWRFALTPDGQAVADRQQLVAGEHGRLRALTTGPDGAVYLATSNRDGRGRPNPGDDRLLRVLSPDE